MTAPRAWVRRVALAALVLGAGLGVHGAAHADVAPGARVRLQSYTPPAVPGGAASFSVRVEARETLTLAGVHASDPESRGSRFTSLAPETPVVVPRGETRVYAFTVSGEAAEGPVLVQFTANGVPVTKSFDFSPANRTKHSRAGLLRSVPESGAAVEPAHAGAALAPEPAPLAARPASKHAVRVATDPAGGAPQSPQGTIVRVRGAFKYQRDDGVVVGADGVTFRVYDEDVDFDELRYEGTTSTNGSFDVTLSFSESEPDIYVEFETSNSHITVEDASLWENNYFYETIRHTNFTGSEIAYGTLMPDAADWPVLHIFTNLVRAWRWWAENRSNTVDHLDCLYPEVTWPHYVASTQEIHMPYSAEGRAFRWASDTHVHEYAHHLRYQFQDPAASDYDNGICNREDGSPGHCGWCSETGATAINEGWPNWYAGHVLSQYASRYGVAANHTRDSEWIQECRDGSGNVCACDPFRTEGFFQTLFKDLVDDTPGEHDPESGKSYYFDRIDLTVDDALDVLSMNSVNTTQQFLDEIRSQHPEIPAADWWSTLNNAGFYEPDGVPPVMNGLFWSPTHSTSSSSPDRSITVQWQPATDGESGMFGYLLHVSETLEAPSWNDHQVSAGASEWHTPFLTAGHSYYVSIRPFDNERNLGNWRWVGPYALRNPSPPDMMATTPGSAWYRPLVARDAGDESGGAQPTASLPGNTSGTWLNVYARNHGELATSSIEAHLLVDGVKVDSIAGGSFAVGEGKGFLNRGPYTVRGGRHALQVYWDSDNAYSEADEDDNLYTTQYTFLPLTLSSILTYTRPAPPMRDAGRSTMDVSQDFHWNCDGLRFQHRANSLSPITSWWSAVALHQVEWADDDDLQLFDASDLSGVGYDVTRARSSRDEGLLDAVFSNRRNHTTDKWDVGVINADSSAGSYRVRHVVASPLAMGDSVLVTQGAQVMLSLRELTIGSADAGLIEVTAHTVRGPTYLYGLRFATTFQKGGIEDYAQKVAADDDGVIRMTFSAAAGDIVPLAFYRNPSSSPAESTITFTLQVRRVLPDVVVNPPSNWYGPLVPRASSGIYTFGITAPTALEGDDAGTWLNWSYVNNASAGFPDLLQGRVRHDLTTLATPLLIGGMNAFERSTVTNSGPFTLPGGRHVLSLGLDWPGTLLEEDEGNNVWAEQWVWTADSLSFGEGAWRKGTNGARNALWGSLSAGEVAWPNADGVRVPWPPQPTRWFGAAVLPGFKSDVDLYVHERSTGAKDGFEEFLASSEWGRGAVDYVLWDASVQTRREFDLGLQRVSSDTTSYVVQPERATSWSTLGGTHSGQIAAGDILDLHEFDLPAGIHRFVLTPTSGAVDYGMALHAPGAAFSNRSAGDALGAAWLAPEGAGETFTVTIATPGRHALAVWKAAQADVADVGRYSIQVTSGTADVEAGVPAATRLAYASPNPSARSTAIRFELAREGEVELDVYDMRGARVVTLLRGVQGAGPHDVAWDGRDGEGRRCAAGVYLARLRAAGFEGSLKLVRVE
ncbi:MAG: FlgD immunoglobulin-like domain containing protein [Candidatus Eisenbacteria bacterium]